METKHHTHDKMTNETSNSRIPLAPAPVPAKTIFVAIEPGTEDRESNTSEYALEKVEQHATECI